MMGCPDFSAETELNRRGFRQVCGTDEAGRGPLAGPVVAAAVILDPARIPAGLDDSKKLSPARRTALFQVILQDATVAVASVSPATIDTMNIRAASLDAMRLAIRALGREPCYALVDGNAIPADLPCPAKALVKGDGRSLSIAAASIIAKVTRDRMMETHHLTWPAYGFASHKGYPTASHREAVTRYGPCSIHRRSFSPVKSALEERNPSAVFRDGLVKQSN